MSIRHSLRRISLTRRSTRQAGIRFCDGCSEVTDAAARAVAHRRSQEAWMSLRVTRI